MKQPPSIHKHPGSPFPESHGVVEALLRSLLGALEPVVIRLDEEFKIRFISRIAPEFELDRVIGADALIFVDERFHAAALSAWQAALRGELGFTRTENSVPSGVRRSYETWVGPYDGPDGRGVTMIAIEVTPYREQERMLLQTEASLLMAQEATGIGLWSWDLLENRVRWNERMEAICGQTEPLTLPDYIERLVHPEDRASLRSSSNQLLHQPRFSTPPYRILRADGTTRMVRTFGTVLRDENGQLTGVVGGMLDVTAEHKEEELARQRQRLESIGQLTAGIAHNFNNLLAGIIPTLQLLTPTAPPRMRLLADDALRSAVRAAEIVQQLSHYARQDVGPPVSATGVAEPVGRAVSLCHGLFDPSVDIVQEIEPSPLYVSVGDAELEQAIVNLLLNARDAVAGSPSP
ncbi:MAG TPA: PAS domain-containing protein, partial [Labilithrix sp.]|nr:PAS domain-containing protein [Labilithrix sp.]